MPFNFDHQVLGKQQSVRDETERHIHSHHLLAKQIAIIKTPDDVGYRYLGSQLGMQDIVILEMDFDARPPLTSPATG